MTLACIRLIDVWNWLNNSQLVSTLLILLFGTFAFESWLKRKEANREMIWWLINHIEEYAVLANDYWSEHPTKETKQLVRAARLKSEYSVLMTSVDNVNGVSKSVKRTCGTQLRLFMRRLLVGSLRLQRNLRKAT